MLNTIWNGFLDFVEAYSRAKAAAILVRMGKIDEAKKLFIIE